MGQVWHIPTAEPLTAAQYVALAAAEAGVPARVTGISPLMLRVVSLFTPAVREMVEMQYEFMEPYVVDGSRYARAFPDAPAPTGHREAFRATVTWYQERARTARTAQARRLSPVA